MGEHRRLQRVAIIVAMTAVCLLALPLHGARAEAPGRPVANPNPAPTDEQVAHPEDTAVATILAANPLTPRERVRAAIVLLKLGRVDLAKQMLQKVVSSPLDPVTLNALHQEFGSAPFFEFASRPDLAPEGGQLAQLVFDAVRQFRTDPSRLQSLVDQLCQETGEGWVQAVRELIEAGTPATVPLITVLLDPARLSVWPRVETVLARLRPDSEEALISLLLSVPEEKKMGLIHAVTALQIKSAVPYLLATATCQKCSLEVRGAARAAVEALVGVMPSARDSVRLMIREAEAVVKSPVPLGREVVSVLQWDAATGTVVLRQMTYELWRRERSAYLAEAAYALSQDDPQLRDLAAVLNLEKLGFGHREEWTQKTAQPGQDGHAPTESARAADDFAAVHQEVDRALAALKPTLDDMNRWLDRCLDQGWNAGAWAAIAWLAEEKNPAALQSGAVPPLVKAARAADRSLRFAALRTVLELAPGGAFRGSSYLWQELMFFARGTGRREAVVATPSPAEGAQLAAYLKTIGFSRVVVVATGGDLLRVAPEMPDCEVILASAAIQNPPVDLTLQRLRSDPHTMQIPLLLYAESEWLPRADHVAQTIPVSISVATPQSPEDLAGLIARVGSLPGADRTPAAQRLEQARQALNWLLVLCESPPQGVSIVDLEQIATAALDTPGQETLAIEILARLATPAAQTQLVEAASRDNWPLELRVKALGGFREAVEKRGVQLTTQQILRQYERYNQSAHRDPAVQKLLGLILDCIETPARLRETRAALNP